MDFTVLTQFFSAAFGEYWGAVILTIVCAVSAVIAAFTPAPTESSGKFYRAFYAVVNFFAVNMGRAKNADEIKK